MGNLADYLCTACLHEPRTIISTLCDTHYFEWQEEKMYMELEMSTEGMYL
jgi:hypothetical protein